MQADGSENQRLMLTGFAEHWMQLLVDTVELHHGSFSAAGSTSNSPELGHVTCPKDSAWLGPCLMLN